jgi:transposase
VKPFVKCNKTDARDAAAICVAALRPEMRGRSGAGAARLRRTDGAPDERRARASETSVGALRVVLAQLDTLTPAIAALENRIKAVIKADPDMRRLARVPSVGFVTAHAVAAAIGDGRRFACVRDFTAWMGITPRENSSAGKRRTGGLSRQGESRLRKLFALGAVTLLRNARSRADRATQWQRGILARRPMKAAVMAQAAKTARIVWAVLVSGKDYARRAV